MDGDYAIKAGDWTTVYDVVVMYTGDCESCNPTRSNCITRLYTEAEYMTISTGVRETIFVRYICSL